MANSQDGIQALLAAEQEAQAIVTAARAEKATKLKQAREEAEREITAYKADLEEKYQGRLSEQSGSSGANVERLSTETNQQIQAVKQQAAANSKAVLSTLLSMVTTVPVPAQ
mmetsp:Transcript_46460/g.88707  ORF Transcript_46460/g.88707 Transcript_46460/m.88707 type:complete len:112 (-) Transcript_46460:355-690(-)|eukprot:CAMPEP_0114256624 /NCGR_PEP_ID=MMETSP0058-20121206/18270_1 /TAXON_ID=36894 /ORGANISM="Pyramimonas parkeae, CCMP726" /LENGTH=111 /DNA_ID=CAMNT_0001371239 /DNA_START=85 /DNA_END=420 /DNA_ORIENTATION=-